MTTTQFRLTSHRTRALALALVAIVQALLLAAVLWPWLQPRLTGEEVRMRVAPVDPIDPFRGAYVQLSYPDLPRSSGIVMDGSGEERPADGRGTVYVPLVREGDLVKGVEALDKAPDSGPYLRCRDEGWQLRCGIESWFTTQGDAERIGRELATGGGVATIRVSGSGRAAIVGLTPNA